MSLVLAKCIEYDVEQKICTAEEKGKKYSLQNDSLFRIQKIKVDGCLAQPSGQKRCDYLFKLETRNPRIALFIELKGGDLITAVKQAYDSIIYLKNELGSYQVLVRIIGSGNVPELQNNPAYRKLIRLIPSKIFLYRTNRSYTEKF